MTAEREDRQLDDQTYRDFRNVSRIAKGVAALIFLLLLLAVGIDSSQRFPPQDAAATANVAKAKPDAGESRAPR